MATYGLAYLVLLGAGVGLVVAVRRSSGPLARALGAASFLGFGLLAYLRYQGYADVNPFMPQRFQHFNPFFIVSLTPPR